MRAVRLLSRALAGATGTTLGVLLGSRTRGQVGPLEVEARLIPGADGGTTIDLAPLGTAHLRTHRGPLRLDVRATGLDLDRGTDLLDREALSEEALPAAAQLARRLAVRAAVAGLAGAATAAAVALRRPRDVAVAAALSATGLAATGALAAATRDPGAWRDPQLDGLLQKAPHIIGDLKAAPDRLDDYRAQLIELVETGTAVYQRVLGLPDAPPEDAIRLLHVSDLHLSPLALPLAGVLVERYAVDAVIDTGDLVDWGTPLEERVADDIGKLGVPYLFVKGNHDSAGIAAAVRRQPNAIVLDADDDPVHVAGLTFAGMADPRFTADKTTGDDHAEHRVSEAARTFAQTLRERGTTVDALLVHDPAAARALAGLAPLVLAGHTHHRAARRIGDTTVIVQGSSGGSGLRSVQEDPPSPLTLSVLYVDRATRRLWGVDEVTLGGLGRTDVSVARRPLAELLESGGKARRGTT